MTEETFLPVKGYKDYYEIGDLGTLRRAKSKRIVTPALYGGQKKYLGAQLSKNAERTTKYIHRLVAEVFVPEFTDDCIVYHIDRNTLNNIASNLRVRLPGDTRAVYGDRTGTGRKGVKVLQISPAGEIINEWASLTEIYKVLGFSQGNISQSCSGKRGLTYGYYWRHKANGGFYMDNETRNKLIANGRHDLLEIHKFTVEGYAGILPNGNIVDRRKHPEAIPMQKNSLLNIPEPKELSNKKE